MTKAKKITFKVKDKLLDEEMNLDNISLPILAEFATQTAAFLRGNKRHFLSDIKTSIRSGSIAIEVENETGVLDDVEEDYMQAIKNGITSSMDPVRVNIIEQWQIAAQRNSNRIYELVVEDDTMHTVEQVLRISSDTDFKKRAEQWVPVEEYVYGRVYDLGGKNRPNVHLELENGKTIKIGSDVELLTEDRVNRLYQQQLVRIAAERNTDTDVLRNERLISFEHYAPSFDEDSFQAIVQKGRKAWQSISNPTQWLETMRGNE